MIFVLIDFVFFKGLIEDLWEVVKNVEIFVFCKDFIISEK